MLKHPSFRLPSLPSYRRTPASAPYSLPTRPPRPPSTEVRPAMWACMRACRGVQRGVQDGRGMQACMLQGAVIQTGLASDTRTAMGLADVGA